MAGGMHAAALGSGICPDWKKGTAGADDVMGNLESGESVEIAALSEERSQEAALILRERHLTSKPMGDWGRRCNAPGEGGETPAGPRRSKGPMHDRSPLVRLAFQTMPVLTWLPTLNFRTVRADLIAGLTVGVMVIPQSMSYAAIAGLPYIYGMYSACIPTLVYAVFGQSRQLAVGPVAMVSLLIEAGLRGQLSEEECPAWYENGGFDSDMTQAELCPAQYVNLACLTAMAVGVMQFAGSILKMGFLVSFLGHPVTSGFTSGAAIIIGLSQLKYVLGFEVPKSQFVHISLANIVRLLGNTNGMTLLLGIIWLGYLVVNKNLARKFKKLALLGPLGPLISCGVGIFLMWAWPLLREDFHVKYIGEIPSGLMPLSVGGWRLSQIPKVIPTALSACLIGYMESIAIGKNLAAKHGYEIEAGQEMLALGLSNVVGSVLSCYPVTGSFSRSAVNNSTGALSQLSGFITAVVMLCTLMFLTPLFYYLPKFALAAIVMNSVIPLVAFSEARKLWSIKRQDFVLWVVAFLGTLFLGVLMGIAVSVLLSLVIVIYESVRPQITILWRIPGTTIYRNMKQESSGSFIPNVFICRIGSSMYFANASYIKDMLLAYVSDLEEANPTEYIVLEMTAVVSVDSTAVHIIQDIVNDFRSRGIQVAFAMVGNRVERTLRRANLKDFIGDRWFFPTVNEAVHYCLRHQHAKKLWVLKTDSDGHLDKPDLEVEEIKVHAGNEIGFSNSLHAACTVVFISLTQDVPMIMSEILVVFKLNKINIIRAQVEPLGEDGAKHSYFVKSIRTDSKLVDSELERLREELEVVIQRHVGGNGKMEGSAANSSRLEAMEKTLSLQQDNNKMLSAQIKDQSRSIEQLLAALRNGGPSEGAGGVATRLGLGGGASRCWPAPVVGHSCTVS